MVTFGTPFMYVRPDTEAINCDPNRNEELGVLLEVLHKAGKSFAASSFGGVVLRFDEGSELRSEAHPEFEAWESHGSGDLASASLLATIGRGSPWG